MSRLRALIFGLLLISGCGSGLNPHVLNHRSSKGNHTSAIAIKIFSEPGEIPVVPKKTFISADMGFAKEHKYRTPRFKFPYLVHDTVFITHTNWNERLVLLGEMTINSVSYEVHTIFRRVAVVDDYRGSSFITFKNRKEKIKYEIWNGDISQIVSIHQNKLVILDEAGGSPCMQQIDSLPDEMVFDCGIGLLQRHSH